MRRVVREPAPWVFEPGLWHCFEKRGSHYLYVDIEQSFAGYGLMVKLSDAEYAEYHQLGWTFLQYFAEKISQWPQHFLDRKVDPALEAEALEIIRQL